LWERTEVRSYHPHPGLPTRRGKETIFEAMIVKIPWVGVVILAALLLVL
jgi:hypothetical protein